MMNSTASLSSLLPAKARFASAWRPALFLATSLGLLASAPSQAQNVSQYTFAASAGTFTPVVGGTVPRDLYVPANTISANDGISEVITLPFAFMYGGVARTALQATTDGYIDFRGNFPNNYSQSINTLTRGENTVAPYYDDLNGLSGTASYATTGTAPNRVFTFQWLNWSIGNVASPTSISFQVKLYETTNVIEFVYRPESGAFTTASASIGLGGNSAMVGSRGNFISLTNATASPTLVNNMTTLTSVDNISTRPVAGQVYRFTPNVMAAARPEFGTGSLAVYPNPAQRAFTLRVPALAAERTAQVTLFNSLGQPLQARSLELLPTGTETQVDVSNLATGLYTLRVQAGKQTASQQVVVE